MKSTRKLLSISLIGLFTLSGCGMNSTNNTNIPGTTSWSNITWEIQQPLTDDLSWTNNEYTLFFDDNTSNKTLTIHHQAAQQDKVYFINDGFDTMQLNITTPTQQKSVNYRLSQIIMPNGQSDGPFGRDLTYNLDQNGWYQLIFGESLMQGDIWTGDATVSISLSKDPHKHQLYFNDTKKSETIIINHESRIDDTISFTNDWFKKLAVVIAIPNQKQGETLRLSQITLPDGTTDGPFGNQTSYNLTQTGIYQLRIGENMMAWTSWTGSVLVTLSLSK